MKTLRHLRIMAAAVLLLLFACREEQEVIKQKNTQISKTSIGYKKLSEIPGLEQSVNIIKEKVRSGNAVNKSISDLNLDTDNVLVMDLKDNGRNISVIINHDDNLSTSYFVMNLNIIQHDGIESYFITKYIPTDGKPFYSYSDFVGRMEIYDLDGNLINTSSPNMKHLAFILGCWGYVIQNETGLWNIESVECVCAVCGGGGEPGGNNNGSGTGYGNTGYPGTGNTGQQGGGGGGGSGNDSPGIPNIPSQNIQDQKKYTSFLNYLSLQQYQFLAQQPNYNSNVFNYLKNNNFTEEAKYLMSIVINHLISNTDEYGVHIKWADISPMFDFVKKFLQDNPDTLNKEQIFVRIKALEVLLEQNPDALLDIPCSQLALWQDVSKYQIPQSVKNKLNSIPNQNSYWSSWEIADLESGAGARVNMDLFPVKITTMPTKPNGQKYTTTEFFDFFRKNINLFAEKFTPIEDNNYNIHDTALWNSSNPLGALIHIEIPLDNGTVVCSGYSTNTWIFTTIKAPLSWGYDGIHPVAGNRKFSYYTDPNDGSITIYTRGVDRLSSINSNDTPLLNFLMESYAFSSADDLWSDMQTKLSAYINLHGGSSTKVTPEKFRPKYEGIENYLKGKTSISTIGCK